MLSEIPENLTPEQKDKVAACLTNDDPSKARKLFMAAALSVHPDKCANSPDSTTAMQLLNKHQETIKENTAKSQQASMNYNRV